MITITLGTIPYPFNRVADWLHLLIEKGTITEPIFLQYGVTDIKDICNHKLVTAVPLLPYGELLEKMNASRLVISHAGEGSTRKLAKQDKSFVIVPRFSNEGEHIDNHQIGFSQSVEALGVTVCTTLEDVESAIISPPEPLCRELLHGPRLVDFLSDRYPPSH